MPGKWTVAAHNDEAQVRDTERLAQWWKVFADDKLNWLIEQASNGNFDLKLAQARLHQARANRELAEGGMLPKVSASTGASRTTYSSDGNMIAAQSGNTLYNAGFDASWELDIFGGNRRGVEASKADYAAKQANLDNARVTLIAELARNYFEFRSYQRRLSLARESLSSYGETVKLAEWRFQSGLIRANELEQARLAQAQAQAGIPDLETALGAAENRIAVLLGRNPGELHEALAEAEPLSPIPTSIATGIPADVLRQRPDLIAAERTLAAETARVGQKMAQRYPSLNLSTSFGWQAFSVSALGEPGKLTRALSGSLAATLFDGGQLKSQVEAQSAVQEQALASYQSAVLGALEEIENALKSYAAGRERVEARRNAAEFARRSTELTVNLYQSGMADFQQMQEAKRTQLNAEDSLVAAEATLRTSLITLYKSLGGGWDISKSEKTS